MCRTRWLSINMDREVGISEIIKNHDFPDSMDASTSQTPWTELKYHNSRCYKELCKAEGLATLNFWNMAKDFWNMAKDEGEEGKGTYLSLDEIISFLDPTKQ